jgi:hypothetical protein
MCHGRGGTSDSSGRPWRDGTTGRVTLVWVQTLPLAIIAFASVVPAAKKRWGWMVGRWVFLVAFVVVVYMLTRESSFRSTLCDARGGRPQKAVALLRVALRERIVA